MNDQPAREQREYVNIVIKNEIRNIVTQKSEGGRKIKIKETVIVKTNISG